MTRKVPWCDIDWLKSNQLPPERQSIHAVACWFVEQAKAKGSLPREPVWRVWTGLLDHTQHFADEDDRGIKPELEARVGTALGLPVTDVELTLRQVVKKAGGRRPYGLFRTSGHAYGKVRMKDLAAVCIAVTSEDPDANLRELLRRQKGRIFGLALAGFSQLAHVLRPDLYPILNGRTDFSDWQQAVSDNTYLHYVSLSVALRRVCDRLGFPREWRFKYFDRYLESIWLINNENYSESEMGIPKGSADALQKILLQMSLTTEAPEDAGPETMLAADYVPGSADDREQVYAAIKARRGQDAFRTRLLSLHNRQCQITGCSVEAILEAAHIHAYQNRRDHHPANGLLLRADIHTLFDLGLLWIEPDSLTVRVSIQVNDQTYRALDGVCLRHDGIPPSRAALQEHVKDVVCSR